MKKLIALFLCVIMCLPLFAACNDEEPVDTTGTAAENTPVTTNTKAGDTEDPDDSGRRTDWIKDVATNDWQQHTFKVLYPVIDNAQTDFICNAPDGNTLNDQVYQRNTMVETMLNITIHTDADTLGTYESVLQSQYIAGKNDGDYDITVGDNRAAIKIALKGHLADIAQYDEVNVYRPYWDQDYVENIMIADSLYSLLGCYSVKANLFVSSICFNKNLFKQNSYEEPYNLVRTYEWTVDKLLEYMDGFAKDIDGDGYDKDKDVFALSGWATESAFGVFYGSGFTYCKNDGETISVDYDRDFLDDVIDATLEVWARSGVYYCDNQPSSNHSYPFDIFSSGRGLFCDIVLQKIGTFFSNMEDDYGILPEPMLTSDQGRYYGYTGYTIPLLVIPRNDHNPERTGNIIEAICAASNDVVIPKMFEIVTKLQNARDEDSAEMIDIIISNKIYDPAHWLSLSGYESLSRMMILESENISSGYIKTYHDKAVRELDAFIDAYDNLKG